LSDSDGANSSDDCEKKNKKTKKKKKKKKKKTNKEEEEEDDDKTNNNTNHNNNNNDDDNDNNNILADLLLHRMRWREGVSTDDSEMREVQMVTAQGKVEDEDFDEDCEARSSASACVAIAFLIGRWSLEHGTPSEEQVRRIIDDKSRKLIFTLREEQNLQGLQYPDVQTSLKYLEAKNCLGGTILSCRGDIAQEEPYAAGNFLELETVRKVVGGLEGAGFSIRRSCYTILWFLQHVVPYGSK